MAQDMAFLANPYIYKSSGFRPRQALMPVVTLVSNGYVLAVGPAVPVTTLKGLIAYGESVPEPLKYSTPGNASIHHLLMALFGHSTGICAACSLQGRCGDNPAHRLG